MLSSDKIIFERLEQVRLSEGLGKGDFARMLGLHPQDYSKFCPDAGSEESKRKPQTLVADLLRFGVDAHWFLTGEGPMRAKDSQPPSPEDRHALEVGRDFIAVMKKAGEGTFKLENDSTADCRLPTAAPETVSDEPFTLPTPPARQQAGPPPSIEAFERSQEGMRSPIRRS